MNEQAGAARAGALHQIDADLRIFFPDPADGELAQGNFQHDSSFSFLVFLLSRQPSPRADYGKLLAPACKFLSG